MSSPLTAQDLPALAALRAARRDNLRTIFEGATLQYGAYSKLQFAASVASTGNAVRSGVTIAATGAQAVTLSPGRIRAAAEALIQHCADVDNLGDIVDVIGGDLLEQVIKEVMPIIGVLMSAKGAAQAWDGVISSGRHLYNMPEYKGSVRQGDPLAAANAVHALTERALARYTVDAARNTAVLGVKIAGLFADLGTATNAVVGLANALTALALQLAQLGTDIKEMRAGNAALSHPETLTLEVFTVCPLLGCYLLSSSDTSNVANFFLSDMGQAGWMDRLELMKRTRLDPLIELSREYIKTSKVRLSRVQAGPALPGAQYPLPAGIAKQAMPAKHKTFSVAGVKDQLESLSRANIKFQFNRLVRAKLPF